MEGEDGRQVRHCEGRQRERTQGREGGRTNQISFVPSGIYFVSRSAMLVEEQEGRERTRGT